MKRIQSSRFLAITASLVLGIAGYACSPAEESMEAPAVEAAMPEEGAAADEAAMPEPAAAVGETAGTAPQMPQEPQAEEEPEADQN